MTPLFQASRRSLAYQFTINAPLMCPHFQFLDFIVAFLAPFSIFSFPPPLRGSIHFKWIILLGNSNWNLYTLCATFIRNISWNHSKMYKWSEILIFGQKHHKTDSKLIKLHRIWLKKILNSRNKNSEFRIFPTNLYPWFIQHVAHRVWGFYQIKLLNGQIHLKTHSPVKNPGGVLKFGFGRDVPPQNLKEDPYKYQFSKKE